MNIKSTIKITIGTLFWIFYLATIFGFFGNPADVIWGHGWFQNHEKNRIIVFSIVICITIFVPLILIPFYSKNTVPRWYSVGKALLYGSLIALALNWIEFFIKHWGGGCGEYCGMENFLLSILSVFYITLGWIFLLVGKIRTPRA